jgi:hypothetical protein
MLLSSRQIQIGRRWPSRSIARATIRLTPIPKLINTSGCASRTIPTMPRAVAIDAPSTCER